MFVLDTNVLSELRRNRPHGGVTAWVNSVSIESLTIAAVTVGEIQIGIEKTRENDLAKAVEIESWLDDMLHRITVLSLDAEIFRIWARILHRKNTALSEDAMIAATALRHGLTVATRNTRHFEEFGVALVNPFAFRG